MAGNTDRQAVELRTLASHLRLAGFAPADAAQPPEEDADSEVAALRDLAAKAGLKGYAANDREA